ERRARSFWRRPWPLRTALGLFALSLALPAVLFFGLQYRTALAEKQAEVEREGLTFARQAADEVSRALDGERKRLKALAASPSLSDDDRERGYRAFHAQATAAMKGERGSIALLRRDGTQFIDTLVPPDSPIDAMRDTGVLDRVLQSGQPEDSDLFMNRLSKRYAIAVFYPVGHDDLVLRGTLPIDYLGDVLRANLPPERIAALYDREGRVIARSRDPAAAVGRLASPELRAYIAGAREGSVALQTAADGGDGAASVVAFTHLPNGWTSAIETPPEIIAGQMHGWERQVLFNLLGFAALAVIGGLA